MQHKEIVAKVYTRWPDTDKGRIAMAVSRVVTDIYTGKAENLMDYNYIFDIKAYAGFDNVYVPVWVIEESLEWVRKNNRLYGALYG